jgi:hypothetical protein
MGALDFLKEFEGRVLDAASYQLLQRNYELQEENNRQLKEKVDRLENDISALQEQVKKLKTENDELKQKLANQTVEEQFVTHEGFAFKRNPDGKYEPTGYCPNCKVVMSNPALRTYQCPKCKYIRRSQMPPDVLAKQLNAKSE